MFRSSNNWFPAISFIAYLLTGCATPPSYYDYTALENSRPRSILVIPPLNNSFDVNGSYIFLATISRPLAEKGYYVFPVAVIDHFLKENGLPTPGEMNAIPLDKIDEHIGADAVLYVSIEDWGQKYQLLTSTTVVHSNLRLIDVKTGNLLWEAEVKAARSSDDGDLGLFGAIIGALVTQIGSNISVYTADLSSSANAIAIHNRSKGLLHGPYFNPDGLIEWNPVKTRSSLALEGNLLYKGKAAGEIAAKTYDRELWTRAQAESLGDAVIARTRYIELRASQLYHESTGAGADSQNDSTTRPTPVGNALTGTYLSKYTGKSLKGSVDFQKENFQVKLVQDGKKISGTFGRGGKIWGDVVDDRTIEFDIFATGGYSRRGIWKIDPVTRVLEGKISANHAEKWNLIKIR